MHSRLLFSAQDFPVTLSPLAAAPRLNIELAGGDVLVVMASNGNGKSTLMRRLAGLLTHGGSITLNGAPLPAGVRQRVSKGIVLCPEGRHLFPEMTVRENLLMGAYLRRDMRQVLHDLSDLSQVVPWFNTWGYRRAGSLSGGEQQLLAVGRALMAAPQVLLLDEPTIGLSPATAQRLAEWIRFWTVDKDIATLVTEQNVAFAERIGTRFAFLSHAGLSMVPHPRDFLADEAPTLSGGITETQ